MKGLQIAMKNMTIGAVKPKGEDDNDPSSLFQVFSSSSNRSNKYQASNVKRNEELIHQLVNDSSSTQLVMKIQVLNSRFIIPLQRNIRWIKLLVI
jgi:hypothetical protein